MTMENETPAGRPKINKKQFVDRGLDVSAGPNDTFNFMQRLQHALESIEIEELLEPNAWRPG
jgi:hypothetical protein